MKRFYKVFILSLILVCSIKLVPYAKILDYSEIISKDIRTSRTSGYNSFPSSIDYSDNEGFSGSYYKEGSSYVISGNEPKYKKISITVTSDSPSFSSSYYYNSGGYSGYLSKSGSYSSSTESKQVSGRTSKGVNYGKICTVAGNKVPNPNYSDDKFDIGNMATWKYWQEGTSWGAYQKFDERVVCTDNFSASWSGTSPVSAYYNDGKYKGSVSYSYIETLHTTKNLYVMTPSNGYTMPYVGQHSNLDDYTYRYSLSGTVYKTVYKQTYTGYVSTEDTRTWRQDYVGVAIKKIEKTLNASFTHNIPRYLEENKSINVTITAKNEGTLSWKKEDLIKLQNLYSDIELNEKFEIDNGIEVKKGETYSWEIKLPPLKQGDYRFSFNMLKDNADGNFGDGLEHTLTVFGLKPNNGTLEVIKYDYKNENKYYIKPNSEAEISVDGYFLSYTNKYPTHNYVKFFDEESNNFIEQKTDELGTVFINDLEKNQFTKINNSHLIKTNKENKNYVLNSQKLKINGEDTSFKLYNMTSYESKNLVKYGEYSDSQKYLIIDGTAPTVETLEDINITSDLKTISINVTNIIEKGSGVKDLKVEFSSNGNKVEDILKKDNDKYYIDKKISDLNFGEVEKFNIKIIATDNVGNEGVLFDNLYHLLKIEANIKRVLEPNDPIFKEGEKGILHIKLYGGFDKVKITFPKELSDLDSSLNREIELNQENYKEIDYEFFVPLGTLNKSYKVQVIGYKNEKKKEVYPSFEVEGSILNQIRTRIRIK